MNAVEFKVWLSTVIVMWGSGVATVVGVLVTLVGGALLLRWYRARVSAADATRRLVAEGLLTPNEGRELLQRGGADR